MRVSACLNLPLRGLAWMAALVSLACGELPEIPAGVCGNGFREEGEDCDTYAPPDEACRPSGVVGACHFDCSLLNDAGARAKCPANSVCGLDDICRVVTGEYEPWGQPVAVPSQALKLGDFDGDGRQDLLALGNASPLWQSLPRLLFFDDTGQPRDVFDPRIPISFPAIVALYPPDVRQQIVFATDFGIGAFDVKSNRSVLPIAYPIQQLPKNYLYRMLRVRGTSESVGQDGVLIFLGQSGAASPSGEKIIVADTGIAIAPMPKPIDELLGEPVAANVDTVSPCEEALFTFTGDSGVYMLKPCDAFGKWLSSTQSPSTVVTLTDNHTVSQILAARVDKDEYVDLLIADESDEPYVAFGRGDGTFVADPNDPNATVGEAWPVAVTAGDCLVSSNIDRRFPLAVGDLNGLGAPDWVSRTGVQMTRDVSVDPSAKQVTVQACPANVPFVREWSKAAIADLNRDGLQDVVAGSSSEPDLDFLRGTGIDVLNPAGIPTGGPLSQLVIGDFDGDRVADVAFSARANATSTADPSNEKLAIAYGNASGPPEAPNEIGSFANIKQVQTAKYAGNDAIDELGVIAQSSVDAGQELSIFIGTAGRHPIAPLGLTGLEPVNLVDTSASRDLISGGPFAIAVGNMGQPPSIGLVAVAVDDTCSASNCSYRVWYVPGTGLGKFAAPIPSQPLPAEFVPYQTKEGKLSVYVLLGDGNRDGVVDTFLALTTGADDTTINLWSLNLPPALSTPTDPPAALPLSTTPGRLDVASSPELVDLDGDKALDLVMIVVAENGQKQLGVVWNNGNPLDLSQISFISVGSQRDATGVAPDASTGDASEEIRGFATAIDRDSTAFVAITNKATYAIAPPGAAPGKPVARRNLVASAISGVPGGDSIALGEMTGDGLLDVAIGASGSVQLYRGKSK